MSGRDKGGGGAQAQVLLDRLIDKERVLVEEVRRALEHRVHELEGEDLRVQVEPFAQVVRVNIYTSAITKEEKSEKGACLEGRSLRESSHSVLKTSWQSRTLSACSSRPSWASRWEKSAETTWARAPLAMSRLILLVLSRWMLKAVRIASMSTAPCSPHAGVVIAVVIADRMRTCSDSPARPSANFQHATTMDATRCSSRPSLPSRRALSPVSVRM